MQLPTWAVDSAERAVKTFAQAFLAVVGLSAATSELTSWPWLHAVEVGGAAVVFSVLTSLASLKISASGTVSLTSAVEPADTGRHAQHG